MKPEFRIFGECTGIDETTFDPDELPFDSITLKQGHLIFEHEGLIYEDIEDTITRLQQVLSSDGKGWVDVIDNEAWTMSRYELSKKVVRVKHHDVDNYLDRYRYYE